MQFQTNKQKTYILKFNRIPCREIARKKTMTVKCSIKLLVFPVLCFTITKGKINTHISPKECLLISFLLRFWQLVIFYYLHPFYFVLQRKDVRITVANNILTFHSSFLLNFNLCRSTTDIRVDKWMHLIGSFAPSLWRHCSEKFKYHNGNIQRCYMTWKEYIKYSKVPPPWPATAVECCLHVNSSVVLC